MSSANLGSTYLFKVNNRNTGKSSEICSELTIKTPERCQWRGSGVFLSTLTIFYLTGYLVVFENNHIHTLYKNYIFFSGLVILEKFEFWGYIDSRITEDVSKEDVPLSVFHFRSSRPQVKKVFLEVSQNLQENTCATVSFLIKLQA